MDRTWRTAPQCRYFITALIDRIDVGANQIDIRLRPRRLSALLDIATSAFTCGLGPRLNWERASTPTMIEEIRFAADSPLEEARFELAVPRLVFEPYMEAEVRYPLQP